MTLAVGVEHSITTDNSFTETGNIGDDLAKHVYRVHAKQGMPIRITKIVSYHTARRVPARELVDRCDRTLDRAAELGVSELFTQQRTWLDDFWERSDVEIADQPTLQQATRWNLFQLAQATARTDGGGVAAKGVSGSGYGGHYFWDSEVYVLPFLSYTAPIVARNVLRFRQRMLDAARAAHSSSTSSAPCSRGEPSTARSRAPTTRRAPRSTTSTPTSPMPSASTSPRPATPTSWAAARSTSSSRPRACGRTSGSGGRTPTTCSTSTVSRAPTSTRRSSTTTCTRTSWRGRTSPPRHPPSTTCRSTTRSPTTGSSSGSA